MMGLEYKEMDGYGKTVYCIEQINQIFLLFFFQSSLFIRHVVDMEIMPN